jgi:hypothetical protein
MPVSGQTAAAGTPSILRLRLCCTVRCRGQGRASNISKIGTNNLRFSVAVGGWPEVSGQIRTFSCFQLHYSWNRTDQRVQEGSFCGVRKHASNRNADSLVTLRTATQLAQEKCGDKTDAALQLAALFLPAYSLSPMTCRCVRDCLL